MFENGTKLPPFVKWGVLNSPEDDCMGAVLKITPGHNILHPLYPLLSLGLDSLVNSCMQFKAVRSFWTILMSPSPLALNTSAFVVSKPKLYKNGKMVTQIQIHSGPSKAQPSTYSVKDNHLQMVWVHSAVVLFWLCEGRKNTAHTFLKKGQLLTNGNLSYITYCYSYRPFGCKESQMNIKPWYWKL